MKSSISLSAANLKSNNMGPDTFFWICFGTMMTVSVIMYLDAIRYQRNNKNEDK